MTEPPSTWKPRDVEEPLDYWLNRRIAARLVALLVRTPITPNQVTVLSGVAGIAAGVVVALAPIHGTWQIPFGGLLLFLSILLDCADGQLARLRGQSSMVGRALDGYVDAITTAAMFFGFAAFLYRAGRDPIFINVLGWSAGYSMKVHAHSYDHAKNIYLYNVLPAEQRKKALPTLDEIHAEREIRMREGDRFGALILRGFAHFTRAQRRGWQDDRMGLGTDGTRTEAERLAYRTAFRSTMRLWTWNGLAMHLALFIIATVLTPLYPSAVTIAWWIMLGPMNVLTLYVRASERRIEQNLKARLRPALC